MSFENAFKTVTELVDDFKAKEKHCINFKCEILSKQIDELVYLHFYKYLIFIEKDKPGYFQVTSGTVSEFPCYISQFK